MISDIIVSMYHGIKKGATENSPKELIYFADVSRLYQGIERTYSELDNAREADGGEEPMRKLVKIELPDDIHFGIYTIANVHQIGYYGEVEAKNGMGRTVAAKCKVVPIKGDSSNEDTIDKAIDYGIVFTVYRNDGKPHDILAKVIKTSRMYGAKAPADWEWSK